MKHAIIWFAGAAIILGTMGCSLCCSPNDYDYPAIGGATPRANPAYGRVGSVFSDPNAMVSGPTADSNLKPRSNTDGNPIDRFDDDSTFESIEPLRR